jgi:hypothetical protein
MTEQQAERVIGYLRSIQNGLVVAVIILALNIGTLLGRALMGK